VNPRFLVSFLNSPAARSELVSRANTVTMATLDQEKIASLPILLPTLQEQRRLTEQIDVVSKRTESLVNSTRSTIARLSEYRAALITAAVTGQLDIRKHEKQMEAIA
jgi:type I restriction enzyme S subunit